MKSELEPYQGLTGDYIREFVKKESKDGAEGLTPRQVRGFCEMLGYLQSEWEDVCPRKGPDQVEERLRENLIPRHNARSREEYEFTDEELRVMCLINWARYKLYSPIVLYDLWYRSEDEESESDREGNPGKEGEDRHKQGRMRGVERQQKWEGDKGIGGRNGVEGQTKEEE